MIHTAASVIGFFLIWLKSLDLLYYFQIKEYRLDRFVSMMKDRGGFQALFAIGKLPGKSLRNIMSAAVATILLTAWSVAAFGSGTLLFLTFAGYFAVAFAATAAGIAVTWLPSYLKRRAIIAAATARIRSLPITTIGITGSFGKTTTKDYLADILSQKFPVAKTPHNMNTEVGVALAILQQVSRDTRYFIAEMGAYRPGEIREICRMTRPRYGILTAIGNQHLDLFGSREKLVAAKKELFLSLPEGGLAFANAARTPVNEVKSRVRAEIIFYHPGDKTVNLNEYHLPPAIIREDLIPCILLARRLGLAPQEIRAGIDRIKGKRQRLTPVAGKNGSTVIDNSYNTNREGFIFSLGVLDGRPEKTKIIVSRGIIELGAEKQETYRQILHVLAKSGITLYTTDADFGASQIKNVRIFKSELAMTDKILTGAGKDTVILIEGKVNKGFISSLLEA